MPIETEVKPKAAKAAEDANMMAPSRAPVDAAPAPAPKAYAVTGGGPGGPASKAFYRDHATRLFETFVGMGLTPYSASILAAHAWATNAATEHTGRSEAIVWAESFKRLNPVPWFDLQVGNINGFVAALGRSNLPALTAAEYAELATAIRG